MYKLYVYTVFIHRLELKMQNNQISKIAEPHLLNETR